MAGAVIDDWPIGQVVIVPHAWRGDGLWQDIQAETQQLIGTDLRAMYAELLRQPLSLRLAELADEIEESREDSQLDH
jgi:hypothetical protein